MVYCSARDPGAGYTTMKVLITGGAGYIGSHTAVELAGAGHTPVIMDNLANAERSVLDRIAELISERPVFYEGDCADSALVDAVFEQEGDIAAVIHFAAFKAVGESMTQPLAYYRNNLGALITVLERLGARSPLPFIFSSSATVYGEPDENPIPETAPRKQATSPYGATKAISEDIIADTARTGGVRAIALRYFNPIGAHESAKIGELPHGVPNNLVPYITQAAAGLREQLTLFGDDYDTRDGTCVRDFIHVVDLARAHIAALDHLTGHPALTYDVFNVGTGEGTTVRELVDRFEAVNGVQVPYAIGPRRPGDIVTCVADPRKINTDMGWHATHTLEDALRDAWRWQKGLTTSS